MMSMTLSPPDISCGLHFQPVRGARTSRAAADTRALRAVTPGSGVETLKLDAFRLLQTT